MTRVRAPNRPVPSSQAASSSSLGMLAKYALRIHTQNGRLNAAFTRMRPSAVSVRSRLTISR